MGCIFCFHFAVVEVEAVAVEEEAVEAGIASTFVFNASNAVLRFCKSVFSYANAAF